MLKSTLTTFWIHLCEYTEDVGTWVHVQEIQAIDEDMAEKLAEHLFKGFGDDFDNALTIEVYTCDMTLEYTND